MNHDRVLELLPDLLGGGLDEKARGEVTTHLAECPDCADALRTLELLATPGIGVEEGRSVDHPSSEEIVDFAVRAPTLDGGRREKIALHLEGCAACAVQVEVTQQVEAALSGTEGGPRNLLAFGRTSPSTRIWAVRIAATVVLALLAYPAFLGLVRLPDLAGRAESLAEANAELEAQVRRLGEDLANARVALVQGQAWAGAWRLFEVAGGMRGEPDLTEIRVGRETSFVPLVVDVSAPAGAAPDPAILFEISGEDGRPVWKTETSLAAAADFASGPALLLVPAATLGEGRRMLQVYLIAPGRKELLSSSRFDIVRGP